MPIQSFGDRDTELFFETGRVKKGVGWVQIKNVVRRKLDMVHYAAQLDDLRSPPRNRLEALKGDFKSFYCIRVNDQWRIIFRWRSAGPEEVSVIDYH